MKRLCITLLLGLSITINAQQITKAEYFIDADPGVGNGTPVTISTPADSINFIANIPVTGLPVGFHLLAIRVRDGNGRWSNFTNRAFYISSTTVSTGDINAAEYFLDTDPGPGNGIPLSIGSPGATISFPAIIPINLAPGFHWLGIRTRNADGIWGFFDRRNFYINKASSDMTEITAAEYFYDQDPGPGNGTPIAVTSPGNIVSQTFMIPVPPAMPAGDHLLAIRVRDAAGNWGIYDRDTLTVSGNLATISCPGNITISATTWECVAVANGIDPTVTPTGSSYTYSLSGATTGNGTGSASGKVFNVGTTTVTYTLTNTPAATCSFTVTVVANMTPSVSIYTPVTNICSGTEVSFAALPVNGGLNPIYQWRRNGIIVGTNSNVYNDSTFTDGDTVTVTMFPSIPCASQAPVTSTPIIMEVTETVTPLVSISASSTTICPGQLVTFTANPVHPGPTPVYQWRLNNLAVGTNSNIFQTSTLQNGDSVSVIMYSSVTCHTGNVAISNWTVVTVNSSVTPSVTISTPQTSICAGTQTTFTAIPVNGGTPSYQWKVNDTNVGINSAVYESSTLVTGDVIKVVMTTSLGCAAAPTATSNSITMTVSPSVAASVSISADLTYICQNDLVTFTANPVNGGNNPNYQWKLNGNNVGTNSAIYQSSGLSNNDSIEVVMTSSLGCAIPQQVTSNNIFMTVTNAVTPSVSISSTSSSICPGMLVTFTATPVYGGTPSYQWKLNGVNVGSDFHTFQSAQLSNGDVVTCIMTSTLGCVTNQTDTSNAIIMEVGSSVTPTVSIAASQVSICSGTPVTFTATPLHAGNSPAFQWKRNGNNVGNGTAVYQDSTFINGDIIKVIMSSTLSCANPSIVSSDSIVLVVDSVVIPSVSITPDFNPVCAGGSVTFTATPINGGVSPYFQWKLNGINVGDNNEIFSSSSLQHGDVISVAMTSSLGCANPGTVLSNSVTMTIMPDPVTVYADLDGDGYGNQQLAGFISCAIPAGYVTNNTDCNDQVATINPAAVEICNNGIDDNCNGIVDENCNNTGWPELLLKTYPVKEGNTGQTLLMVEVKLGMASSLPVRVNYMTLNDEAQAGSDYVATNGVLVIPPGSLSGTLQVRIIGDQLPEHNERFWIQFSNPVNVILTDDPRSRVMIIDDDKGKPVTINQMNKPNTVQESLKIPTVARRNQVWFIPLIGSYENEVFVMNAQGQVVSRMINYKNQVPLSNLTTGIYFYRIRIKEENGERKEYVGKLFISE